MDIPDTHYAVTPDGVYIAYQVIGDGPIDVVWQPDWPGNIDMDQEDPILKVLFGEVASFSRLILHDRRGIGLSSRNVALPNLETRVSDLLVVLDAVGSERPVLAGLFESGSPNALLAASKPERVHSMVWLEPSPRFAWAPDYPWGRTPADMEAEHRDIELWGTLAYGRAFLQDQASQGNVIPDSLAAFTAKATRNACTPDVARDLARIWYETDVRSVLPAVRVPTLILTWPDRKDDFRSSQLRRIADPRCRTPRDAGRGMDGGRHAVDRRGDPPLRPGGAQARRARHDPLDRAVHRHRGLDREAGGAGRRSVEGAPGAPSRDGARRDRALAWRRGRHRGRRLLRHVRRTRACGPMCARHRRAYPGARPRDQGRRACGECTLIDGKVGGLPVTIGARIAARAEASEVLVSQTVKDLVPGSGLTFEDAGERELKGVPDRWHLYRVVG